MHHEERFYLYSFCFVGDVGSALGHARFGDYND